MLAENLQTNLRAYRLKRKMTQQALAESTRFSLSYISEIERHHREPSLAAVETFAAALRVHPLKLLSDPS